MSRATVRVIRRAQGASLVEFALVAPLMLLLVMTALELSLLFWVNLTMQHAMREGARHAVTGQGGALRAQQVAARIEQQSLGLYQRVAPVLRINQAVAPVLRINQAVAPADAAQYPQGLFGAGGDLLVLQIDGAWPVSSPLLAYWLGDVYRFTVAATMRNEAFE